MPGGNQMGPRGEGSKTGRGLGICVENDQPNLAASQTGQRFRRGFGRGGRGRGRGWNNRFNAGFRSSRARGAYQVSPENQDQDIGSLKAQVQELQDMLQDLQTQITEIEVEDKER